MKCLITYTLLFFTIVLNAQADKDSELFLTLEKKDNLLFNEGLNKCNINVMKTLIHDDFEFYHDKGGIQKSKEEFFKVVNSGPCKTGTIQTKRVLVKNSLNVFPLYNNDKLYGAIQSGIHQFGDTHAKFTHLWLLSNDGHWQISRVLSYDH